MSVPIKDAAQLPDNGRLEHIAMAITEPRAAYNSRRVDGIHASVNRKKYP